MNSEIYTDSINGNYYRMLAPGVYSFEFSADEYMSQTINNVFVTNFNTTILDVQLVPNSLPVELLSFNVSVNDKGVLLEWKTATENNNSGFEIQKQANNQQFSNTNWELVGYVDGFGTTTEPHNYSFTDNNIQPGYYSYRLKQIDYDGSFEYSEIVEVEVSSPKEFILNQNYPNPFNPSTEISFRIPETGEVTLKIFDVLGNEMATLVNEVKLAGKYEIEFNGDSFSSGVYFYSLSAVNYFSTKKMILLK